MFDQPVQETSLSLYSLIELGGGIPLVRGNVG